MNTKERAELSLFQLYSHTFWAGLTIAIAPTAIWFMGSGRLEHGPMFAGLPPYDPSMIVWHYPGWVATLGVPVGLGLAVTAVGLYRQQEWARRLLLMFVRLGFGACCIVGVLFLLATVQIQMRMQLLFHIVAIFMVIFSSVQLTKLHKELQSPGLRRMFCSR